MASKRAQRRRAEQRGCLKQFLHMRHGCANKTRFANEALAGAALESLMNCDYFDGGDMNVYLCPAGQDHWHFGHIPRRMM